MSVHRHARKHAEPKTIGGSPEVADVLTRGKVDLDFDAILRRAADSGRVAVPLLVIGGRSADRDQEDEHE